jgi:hypothetical protein
VVRNHDTPASSRFEVDEVMIHPVAGAPAKSAPDRNLGREQTLRLLVG